MTDGAHVEPTTAGFGEAQGIPASGGTLMFSDHPSSPGYQPIGTWSLFVFLVSGHSAQQGILRSILDLGRDGVTALGTRRGSEHFVIVDYSTDTDRAHAKRVVLAIDPGATITFSGRKHELP
jgi:hypothetical protein